LSLVEVDDGAIIMPGLVDTHVHINEPGRIEWEGFETATRAAAAGGVTTLVEMPLNSIPATTAREHLETKRAAAEGKCHVDVGFWGGVVPGNLAELRGMHEGGVFGFKCFLVPSGVDEFPHVTEADLRAAMPELARLGALLIVPRRDARAH
jgi:allantoinase